jgi:hypothetical protein|tara:strand:+ start:195 stop:383 length:189 start_codon:yes stop_codon:yes gene_type:complete
MNVNLIKSGATYATKRKTYYPLVAEQLDLLYHDIDAGKFGADAKTGTLYVKLKAVKDKYPKG